MNLKSLLLTITNKKFNKFNKYNYEKEQKTNYGCS